ncbi:MAG: hypothetical protein GXO40_05245 [Epsilonproteobacteria bacterium]|nr:hypothetical protein [Campylobacterota bacterium]
MRDVLRYIRDDIELNIKSNIPLPIAFNPDAPYIQIDYKGRMEVQIDGVDLTFEEIILIFLYLINASSREQIGVVIPKYVSNVLDNELTYLIIKRQDNPEYSDIYFVVHEDKIIFPFFSKEENKVFNVLKFAELIKRRDFNIKTFLQKIHK